MGMSVYLKAAESIANKERYFACWAVNEIAGYNYAEKSAEIQLFEEYFRPKDEALKFRTAWMEDDDENENKSRKHRVIALLLMHEISKDLK